jgi:hypothetical protein
MRTFTVVKHEIPGQTDCQFTHRGVTLQIYILMLDAAPQTLDENVIECPVIPC